MNCCCGLQPGIGILSSEALNFGAHGVSLPLQAPKHKQGMRGRMLSTMIVSCYALSMLCWAEGTNRLSHKLEFQG